MVTRAPGVLWPQWDSVLGVYLCSDCSKEWSQKPTQAMGVQTRTHMNKCWFPVWCVCFPSSFFSFSPQLWSIPLWAIVVLGDKRVKIIPREAVILGSCPLLVSVCRLPDIQPLALSDTAGDWQEKRADSKLSFQGCNAEPVPTENKHCLLLL